jgi:uncharacterized membrane protein SirB2
MNSYFFIKTIHIITVTLSLSGFLLRAWWRFNNPAKLKSKVVRSLPHINDTLLLVSAIMLTIKIEQYPFIHSWLTGKVIFLLLYIIAGSIALKIHFKKQVSLLFLLIALLSFSTILLLAKFHSWQFVTPAM